MCYTALPASPLTCVERRSASWQIGSDLVHSLDACGKALCMVLRQRHDQCWLPSAFSVLALIFGTRRCRAQCQRTQITLGSLAPCVLNCSGHKCVTNVANGIMTDLFLVHECSSCFKFLASNGIITKPKDRS